MILNGSVHVYGVHMYGVQQSMEMAKQVEFDPWPHLYTKPLATNHTLAISTTFCPVRNREDYFLLDQVDPTQISTMSKPD